VVRKETTAAASANHSRAKKKNGVACVIDQYKFIRKTRGSK
jgi:hypothetical protein